jgi:hypothetical protein
MALKKSVFSGINGKIRQKVNPPRASLDEKSQKNE